MVKSTMTGNGDVFRSRRNCSSDGAERTDGGRAFHARAAAIGKARSPSMVLAKKLNNNKNEGLEILTAKTNLDFIEEEHCRDELITHETTGRPTTVNEL